MKKIIIATALMVSSAITTKATANDLIDLVSTVAVSKYACDLKIDIEDMALFNLMIGIENNVPLLEVTNKLVQPKFEEDSIALLLNDKTKSFCTYAKATFTNYKPQKFDLFMLKVRNLRSTFDELVKKIYGNN